MHCIEAVKDKKYVILKIIAYSAWTNYPISIISFLPRECSVHVDSKVPN